MVGAGVLALAVLGVVAILSGAFAPLSPTYTATGSLQLLQQYGTGVSNYTIPTGNTIGGCEGINGYDDIKPGTGITVKDENGKVLGTGSLGLGSLDLNFEAASAICRFDFEIGGLPKATFYEIGTGRRGSITNSFDQMVANKWVLKLTLGP